MRFDNSDKSFTVKVGSLIIILVIGVFLQKSPSTLKNAEQDVINIESKYPNTIKSYNVKKSTISALY